MRYQDNMIGKLPYITVMTVLWPDDNIAPKYGQPMT